MSEVGFAKEDKFTDFLEPLCRLLLLETAVDKLVEDCKRSRCDLVQCQSPHSNRNLDYIDGHARARIRDMAHASSAWR